MYIHALECKQCKQCLQCGADSVCNQDFRKCFSIANTVCKYSCVHIDSTLDAVDPVHSRNCTVCSICAAVPTACRPGGPRAIAMGGRAACMRWHTPARARRARRLRAGGAASEARMEQGRSDHGATTERLRSDHGATTERRGTPPRSSPALPHGAAPRHPHGAAPCSPPRSGARSRHGAAP